MSRLIQVSLFLGAAVVFGVGTALAQRIIAPDPIDPALTTVTNPGKRPVFGTPTPPVSPPSTECAGTTETWSVGTYSCSGALPKTSALQIVEASDTQKPNTGKASYRCKLDGTWEPHSVSRNTCGPTECPAQAVTWTVGANPKQCTGSTVVTDIGKTYAVSGTRVAPAAGSATGTFLCQADATWKHQDPGTDVCPQDCDAPTPGSTFAWDGDAHGETWTCQAPAPSAPDTTPARTQWIVGDTAPIDDNTPREGDDAQDGIGTATVACVDAPGGTEGTFDVTMSQCAPADCSPGASYWWSHRTLRCPTQGGQGHMRRYKVWCSSDDPMPLVHGATGQLSDALDPHSSDDRTSGSTTGACDNSEFTPVNSACTPYYSGYGGYYTRDRNALTGVSRNSELDDPRGC